MDILSSIASIPKKSWLPLEQENFPFTDYDFLKALEVSLSIGEKSGWIPKYFTKRNPQHDLTACALYYDKHHSYGEYIFDWAWADAYHRFGQAYYPKMTSAVPNTPATGSKILTTDPSLTEQFLGEIEVHLQEKLELTYSSVHALFIPENSLRYFTNLGYMTRKSLQFHWHNQDYKSFEEFLQHLKGKKRKAIVKERREVLEHGLKIKTLTGEQLTPEIADHMYRFYRDTTAKMGAIAYLTRSFFEEVFSSMADRILVLLAYEGDSPVAGSINFKKGENLYGRYWGCTKDFKHLHFELCYYQTIDFAIQNKIRLFEAGAQGMHKIQRGFLPAITHSAHKIADPRFAEAIGRFIKEESTAIDQQITELNKMSPFKPAPS